MFPNGIVVERATRDYVNEIIREGDIVTIGDLDDKWCDCSDDIGVDEEMYDYEHSRIPVRKVYRDTLHQLSCGGETFSSNGWMWSTCWITKLYPDIVPKPTWEV